MTESSDVLKAILSDPDAFNKLPDADRQRLLGVAGIKPPKSLLDKAKDLVTGEGQKEFDYPDFDPRYLDPSFKPMVAGLSDPRRLPKDDRALSYNATVHNLARQNVLENFRPDLAETLKEDKFGNPYIMMEGKPYYLNRPGASGQDLREAGAVALAASAPLASRSVRKGLSSPSVLGRGATATGVGASASALQDLYAMKGGSGEGVSGSRAAMNALLSGATMFAWPIIRAIGVKPFQAIFGKPALTPSGEFTTEAIEAMRVSGVDPSTFSAAERAEVARLMKEATDPGALAAAEQALRMEPPVKLTAGQASGDRAQQAVEYQMREGLLGGTAKEQMGAFDTEARSAMAQNIQKMRERLAGGPSLVLNERGAGVEHAQLKLGQDRIAAKAKYGQLYKDIEDFSDDALAWVETPERFRQTLLNMPDVKVNREFNKRLDGIIKDYEKNVMKLGSGPAGAEGTAGSAAPSVNELFAWRKRLNATMQEATPGENVTLRKIKTEFDKFMRDTVADGLVRGDPKLVEMWGAANKARADYGRLFEGDDIIDHITTLTKDGLELAVDPHQASNLIFGASDMGFVSKWNIVKNMQTLKSRLPKPQWDALRGDALLRMFGMTREELEAVAAGSAQLPSGAKFKTAYDSLRTKNPGLFRALFDEQESQLIGKVADVWKRVTVPKQGASNPSGSGLWVLQAGQRAMSGPMGGLFRELLALASPTARIVIKPIKGSFKVNAATRGGEGYYPPTKTLVPPSPAVSPVVGGEAERLLEKYEDYP